MRDTSQKAENLEYFLDNLAADPLTPTPPTLDAETAQMARSVMSIRDTKLNHVVQKHIWQHALAGVRAQSASKRTWRMPGIVPLALAGATVAVFLALWLASWPLNKPIPSAADQTATPTPTVVPSAFQLQSYQGVVSARYDSGGLQSGLMTSAFQSHVWYQAPNRHRYENYFGAFNNNFINGNSNIPAVATAMSMAAQSTAVPINTAVPLMITQQPTPLALESGIKLTLYAVDVSDGDRRWLYYPGSQSVYAPRTDENRVNNIEPDLLHASTQGEAGLQELIHILSVKNQDVKLLRTENFLNRPTYVLEMKPKVSLLAAADTQNVNNVGRAVVWIDQQIYLELKSETYDLKDKLVAQSMFSSLQINQPIDPAIFKLTLPENAWTNAVISPLDRVAIGWHIMAAQVPYPIFQPSFQQFNDNGLLAGIADYDPFSGTLVLRVYSRKAPYGAPVLTISESVPPESNMDRDLNIQGGVKPVQVGTDRGAYWEQDKARWLMIRKFGTRIVLQAQADSSLTENMLIDIGKNFDFAVPYQSSYDLTTAWQGIAQNADFPVYSVGISTGNRSTYYSVSGTYGTPGNLVAGMPILSAINGEVKQEFYSVTKPETALLLTEGTSLPTEIDLGAAQTVQVGSYLNSSYYEDTSRNMRWLVLNLRGTIIILRARFNAVTKEQLFEIGASLHPVTLPEIAPPKP